MAWERNRPLKGPDGEPLSANVAASGPHDEKGQEGENEWVENELRNRNGNSPEDSAE